MCENHGHEHHHHSINHAEVAESLLGRIGVPELDADTIALAQVHATLALAQVNSSVGQIVGAVVNELNNANMFQLAATMDPKGPLPSIILGGLVHELMGDDAAHPEILLADHIQRLGLQVEVGNDVTLSNDHQSHDFIAVDPANDVWQLLDEGEMRAVSSPQIFVMFGANVTTLDVSIKEQSEG